MRRSTPPLFDFDPAERLRVGPSSISQLERQLARESLPLLPVTKMTAGQPGRESGHRPSGTRQRGECHRTRHQRVRDADWDRALPRAETTLRAGLAS